MDNRFVAALGPGKKMILGAAGTLAIVTPLVVGLGKAQALQTNARFTFEIASVKPAPERDYGTYARPTGMPPEITGNPVRIDFSDVDLVGVICRAYGVRPLDIRAPGWMQEKRYDIHAKAPMDVPKGHIPEMLQNLLADRFQIKLHWNTREEPGYILTVAKGGLKLKQPAPDDPHGRPVPAVSFTSSGHIEHHRTTITRFANALRWYVSQPVIDKTEVPGEYDITFDAAPGSMPGFTFGRGQQQSDFPTIFVALRKLGLDLTHVQKVSTRYLVVDSALKAPTAN